MAKQTDKPVRASQVHHEPMRLNSQNRSPLYHQIFLILRSRILDGEYAPGDYLPGERELEALFKVSRITAVRALNELAAQGLVVRERGRGTRVQLVSRAVVSRGPLAAADRPESSELPGTVDGVRIGGLEAHKGSVVTLHEFSYQKAKKPVAEALQLAEGDLVQYSVRAWRVKDEQPFNYLVTYVPEEIARQWSKTDLEKHRLGKLLARHGVHIAHVQEQVTATLADILLSQRLEVAAGSPILKIRRIAYDANDRPVEFVTGFYPPDRYHYEVSLLRKGGQRWESD